MKAIAQYKSSRHSAKNESWVLQFLIFSCKIPRHVKRGIYFKERRASRTFPAVFMSLLG